MLLHGNLLGDTADGFLHRLHAHKAIEFLHHVVDGDFLRVGLANDVGVGELVFDEVRLLFAQTVAFQCQIKEVAHLTGVAKGVAALKIHTVEHFGEHFLRLRVEGENGVLIVAFEVHTEQLL